MVDRALTVYSGEDMSPSHDLTDELVWEEAVFVSRAANGESTLSTLRLRDETVHLALNVRGGAGKIINAKNVLIFTHGSNTLWRGRVGDGSYVKGARDDAHYREVLLQATDYNEDLRGIIVDGWVRPVETDVQRAQGLAASYLQGNGRPTTIVNASNFVSGSNLVTLPAKTYNQTDPLGVLSEIAAEADKQFFIFPVATSTTTGELFYDGYDSVEYRCPFRFTDRPAEVKANPTTTFPVWRDDTREVAGQQFLSGVRAYYGQGESQYAEVTNPTDEAWYARWEESVNVDVDNAIEAALYANAVRGRRSVRFETYSFSSGPFTDAQIGSIRAGQLASIKGTVFGTGNVYIDRRIVELQVKSNEPGAWFITMVLESPRHSWGKGLPHSPQPPTGNCVDLTGTLAPDSFDCDVPISTGGHWYQGGVDTNDGVAGFYHFHGLSNPWAGYHFSGTWNAGTEYTVRIRARVDADASPMNITLGAVTGLRTFGSDKVTLAVTSSEWEFYDLEWTPDSTIVSDGVFNHDGVAIDMECAADDLWGMDFDGLSVLSCTEASPPPASDDDTGDVGDTDSGDFATADHKHPAQTAAVTPITDTGGYFTGTNVEAALQELGAAGGTAFASLIKTGSADPSAGSGVASGQGSIYLRTTGTLWVKFGAGDTDWREVINT